MFWYLFLCWICCVKMSELIQQFMWLMVKIIKIIVTKRIVFFHSHRCRMACAHCAHLLFYDQLFGKRFSDIYILYISVVFFFFCFVQFFNCLLMYWRSVIYVERQNVALQRTRHLFISTLASPVQMMISIIPFKVRSDPSILFQRLYWLWKQTKNTVVKKKQQKQEPEPAQSVW